MDDVVLRLEDLHKRFGSRISANGLSLDIRAGEFFTLLGPSGSGKSTVLRMIGGLETPDSGKIYLRGRNITSLPPWHRKIGMVFQHYANFPHMNVAENIAYGLRRSTLTKSETKTRVHELLALAGLSGFESRRVTQLSGGEQQRVAIARALAPRPAILLLDEPLSALDEKIRREMQDELRAIQQQTETTFIYVTHDQEEALTMSDRVAVLNEGICVQCDEPTTIFQRPKTPFVAEFFRGSNVLEASISEHPDGGLEVGFAHAVWRVESSLNTSRKIALRSEAVLMDDQGSNADVTLSVSIEASGYRGIYTHYRLRLPDGQYLSAASIGKAPLPEGSVITIGINAADIVVLEHD